MFAPLPGVSRSGLTIATALALGLSRTWAVGFSLMIAVPAILGAAVWEMRHVDPTSLSPDRVAPAIAATILAGVVGYFAIIWLTKIVRSGRIWYFSVYLVLLGIVVLAMVAFGPSHLTSVPRWLRTRVATGLLDRCELLSRILRPSFLQLGEAGDSIGAAQGTLDPVALRILDELHELFGWSLFDQEAGQGYALGVVKAPVLGVGIVHGHQLAQVEDPTGLEGLLQLGRAGLLLGSAARPGRRFPRRPSAESAGS